MNSLEIVDGDALSLLGSPRVDRYPEDMAADLRVDIQFHPIRPASLSPASPFRSVCDGKSWAFALEGESSRVAIH